MPKTLNPDFVAMLGQLPASVADGLAECLAATEPSVAVRLNPLKAHIPQQGEMPMIAGVEASGSVPWCPEGYYLPSRADFTHCPAMHQGAFYVQDASSMFISHILRHLTSNIEYPLRYLDACAAPGGKTTAAISALPSGALVVANEYDFRRAEILKENIQKWGSANTVVTRGDTSRFRKLPSFFNIIAADVPCSGEGMMRKDSEACAQWSPALVSECATRQRTIISNLWDALAPAGIFIYSTCTFNRTENEDIVQWLIDNYDAEPIAIPYDESWSIVASDNHSMRFTPTRLRGEGLFMAVLRKGGNPPSEHRLAKQVAKKHARQQRGGAPLPKSPFAAKWPQLLVGDFDISVTPDSQTLRAIPRQWATEITQLCKQLDVISAGVELASLKGQTPIVAQSLAMAAAFNNTQVPSYEVDHDTALTFLRRESLPGFGSSPRGPLLLTYTNLPLGFVNNLGNRANNLYPTPWRILH